MDKIKCVKCGNEELNLISLSTGELYISCPRCNEYSNENLVIRKPHFNMGKGKDFFD